MCLFFPLPIRDLYTASCPQITLIFTEFRALTLITTPPLPLLPNKTFSERSAIRLALRGTRVFSLLLKQFSPKLETEAEAILVQLIKLIGGKTDIGEPRPARVDEGARNGDLAQVRLPLYLISGSLAYWWPRDPLSVYMRAGFLATPSSCACPTAL